jgi:nucleotide-binding universal stress UspA family protein
VPEKIVVAVDGGAASRAALDWIVDRARTASCEVEIVAVEDLDWLPVGADRSHYILTYEDVLKTAHDRLAHCTGITAVATQLLAGDPAEEVAGAGALAGSLVIGSSRAEGQSGAVHGTFALRIAARTTVRLTVVPTGWQPRAGRVVVGIAEDESSDGDLDAAVSEAVRSSAVLVLVHAWSLPAPFSLLDGLAKVNYPKLEAVHRQILDRAAARVTAVAPELTQRCVITFGRPATVLAEVARDEALVVVGSHGYGKLKHLFLGSVGHDVILASPTVVLVVPNPHSSSGL